MFPFGDIWNIKCDLFRSAVWTDTTSTENLGAKVSLLVIDSKHLNVVCPALLLHHVKDATVYKVGEPDCNLPTIMPAALNMTKKVA